MLFATEASIFIRLGDWLGPLLIESTLKATVFLALAAAATCLLRRTSAQRRHAIWIAAFLAILLLPGVARLLPPWQVLPAVQWLATEEGLVAASASFEAPAASAGSAPERMRGNEPPWGAPTPRQRAEQPATFLSRPRSDTSDIALADDAATLSSLTAEGHSTEWEVSVRTGSRGALARRCMACLALAWLAGAGLFCVRLVASGMALHRLQSTSEPLRGGAVLDLHNSLCRRLHVRRPVRLLLGPPGHAPMAWGVLGPCVLLPPDAGTWCRGRLQAVLTHEIGHISRRDPLVQWMVQLVQACHWFNPLVWLSSRRIQVERERACDDLVLNSGMPATEYAEHLLAIASAFPTRHVTGLAGAGMSVESRLEGRVLALLNRQMNRQQVTRGVLAAVAAVSLTISLPIALLDVREIHAVEKRVHETSTEAARPATPPIRLGYVKDTALGKRSIAGSGHAVRFQRPEGARYLMAIEIFASRYGYPEAPDEDFHVYLLDEHQKLIQAFPYPYAMIQRGDEQWYTLSVPPSKVPRQFYVALSFNPQRTKGIYLGYDGTAEQARSYTGRPTTGLRQVAENHEWMVRAVVAREPMLHDPFAGSAAPSQTGQ